MSLMVAEKGGGGTGDKVIRKLQEVMLRSRSELREGRGKGRLPDKSNSKCKNPKTSRSLASSHNRASGTRV
jgi:hypothetical protein